MSTNVNTWVKDPDALLDFKVDWTSWLAGDTITVSVWVVPAGITKASDSHTTTAATIWLSGGTAGTSYEVTNRITTAAGRIDDRTSRVLVRDR